MALYLVIQVGGFLSKIVPRSVRYLIGTAVGEAVFQIWGTKRRILLENVAAVTGLGPRDPQVRLLAHRAMRNYCKYLIEFLELPALSSSHEVISGMKIEGLEHLQAALSRGKGVLLATAHFGSIELPGLKLKDFTDFHAVYDAFRPPYLDRLIQRKRLEKGIDLIPASNIRKMLTVLSSGGTITLLFDRPVEARKGVRVRFFGRDAWVPGGPAVLAMKTGAALVPVYTARLPDKSFESVIYPAVSWSPSGDRDRDMQTVMQRLMDTLQTVVRNRPDQWYMFRPMWPDSGRLVPSYPREAAPEDPHA
jgi:KDO2-lipid IV(A) lauroyltransferase